MNRRATFDWKAAATRIGETFPAGRLHREVTRWAAAAEHRRRRWNVALSGGADSVALLLLIWAHWPGQRRILHALHFDHGIRGKSAARADADFCRRICAALGIRLHVGRWARAISAPRPSEAAARAARMAYFERHARVLWLGHHEDDVAETMLMRLSRGSGGGGLSAPRPVQPLPGNRVHLRPLLCIRKSEIVAGLRKAGVRWREDSTNRTTDYFRNRIRHWVIPAWIAASGRDAVSGAARSRELLGEDDAALESWVDDLGPISKSGDLLLSRLLGKPRAVVRRALHRWLATRPSPIDISRQAFEALLAAVELGRPTKHSIGRDGFAVIRRGRVRYESGIARRNFHRRVN